MYLIPERRAQWRFVVSTIMKFRGAQKTVNFLTSSMAIGDREGLYSEELGKSG
jgi:hypothetical protein